MATCPNCGLWEGVHASGEYCRCNEDGWHNAQPIPQPEPDVPADEHAKQCETYQFRIAELESTIEKLTHRPSVMNARDTAINIVGCLEVRAEPAGASGAFWFIAGPRRTGRNVAEMDAATIRTSIAQALLTRDDKIAALESQVKALTEERDSQAEAVRVLGKECKTFRNKYGDYPCTDDGDGCDVCTALADTDANTIARAAVEHKESQ